MDENIKKYIFKFIHIFGILIGVSIVIILIFVVFCVHSGTVIDINDHKFNDLLSSHKMPYLYLDICGYDFTGPTKGNYNIIYGEITCDGMHAVVNLASKNNIKTFYDFGCGVGKSLVMATLIYFDKAIGVEIVESRYNQALDVYKKLPKTLQRKIEIYNMDMFDFKIKEKTSVLVFASNLLWTNETNNAFFTKFLRELPSRSIIVSSRLSDDDKNNKYIYSTETMLVPMSWESRTDCYVTTVV